MARKERLLGSHELSDGKWLCLWERTVSVRGVPRVHYQLTVAGAVLMEAPFGVASVKKLAELGLARVTGEKPCVLIGGYGFGLTLAEALDRLPSDATVVVSELYPAVLEWGREHLGALGPCRLDDSRVRVHLEDVCDRVRLSDDVWDAILIDTDNDAVGFHRRENDWLYQAEGIRALRGALREGGTLGVWLTRGDAEFERRLVDGGFEVTSADASSPGENAIIYVGVKR